MVHIDLCILEGWYITFPYLLLRAEAVVYTYPMTLYKSLVFEKISWILVLDSLNRKSSRAAV